MARFIKIVKINEFILIREHKNVDSRYRDHKLEGGLNSFAMKLSIK